MWKKLRIRLVSLGAIFFWVICVVSPVLGDSPHGQRGYRQIGTEETGEVAALVSPTAINLPTTATLARSHLELQFYERFIPPISSGYDDFYGIDGPRTLRMALAYGLSDRFMVTLGRSDVYDNVDLRVKYRLWEGDRMELPFALGVVAGTAWNTTVPGREDSDDRNFQHYAQAVVNVLAGRRFGFGVTPSYLYNARFISESYEDTWALGAYGQLMVVRHLSLLAEWNGVIDGYGRSNDMWSLGMEIKVGGHFFDLIVTNTLLMNPSHYLAGSSLPFDDVDEWRFGFNITRVFAL